MIWKLQKYTCFEEFGNAVSYARRKDDRDTNCAINCETMKLLSNEAYGKTLTNAAKHKNVPHVRCDKTSKLVNEPQFREIAKSADDIYEVEMSKNTVCWGLPLQIFVYQYAKLRMLKF